MDESTGVADIVGAGKIQITAISAETGNFAETLAAVALTVKKQSGKSKPTRRPAYTRVWLGLRRFRRRDTGSLDFAATVKQKKET